MKKVGILTFHRAVNYGVHLQAYAMQKIFCQSGFETIIIDIEYPIWSIHHLLQNFIVKDKKIYSWLMQINIAFKMRHFDKKYLNKTKHLVTRDITKMVSFINGLELDAIICGSDEIWRMDNKELLPPSIYYLPKEIRCKRIAFAPSANGAYKLTSDKEAWLNETFKEYSAVYVRDAMAQNLIIEVNGIKVDLTFDPTFLCDFEQFHRVEKRKNKKKRICFMINDRLDKLVQEFIQILGNNYEYLSVFQFYENTRFLPLKVEEFTSVFGQFDLVITNMYHGTVFCIRNNTPFISLDTQKKYSIGKSKVYDLLCRLGLEDRYFNVVENMYEVNKGNIKVYANLLIDNKLICNYELEVNKIKSIMSEQIESIKSIINKVEY